MKATTGTDMGKEVMMMTDCRTKIVFSDIDGTLLTSQHKVTCQSKAAVQKLAQKDIPFVLVSARMPAAIYPITDELDVKMPIISYSGALVLDREGKTLASTKMEEKPTRQLLQELAEKFPQITANFYTDNKWYVKDRTDKRVQREMDITSATAENADFAKLLDEGIYPHKILLMAEPEDCVAAENYFRENYPAFQVVRSSSILLEIMSGCVSKAGGIAVLLKHYGLTVEEALSFGDSYNDIPMLEYTGQSVAMGNAPDVVKAAAKDVTLTSDEDGISAYLNGYFERF